VTAKFDVENLSTSKLSCWVLQSSSNTGEPGRDNLGKCLNGYVGVEHNGDTLSNGSLDPKGIIGSSDTSRWESTGITRYGSGYKATGNLTFKGVTKPMDFFFNYLPAVDHSADKDGTRISASLEGVASFNAKSDYGVTSTSIPDKMDLAINIILRKDS
jgi:polyisoprenoid-binding protein YceI